MPDFERRKRFKGKETIQNQIDKLIHWTFAVFCIPVEKSGVKLIIYFGFIIFKPSISAPDFHSHIASQSHWFVTVFSFLFVCWLLVETFVLLKTVTKIWTDAMNSRKLLQSILPSHLSPPMFLSATLDRVWFSLSSKHELSFRQVVITHLWIG